MKSTGDGVLAVFEGPAHAVRAARAYHTLVTSTVKDLVAGNGLRFEDAGEHELKGVPGSWQLHRVVDG